MPYRLKETGESYAQFLKRNRDDERKAKDGLPENKEIRRAWKMEEEFERLSTDPEAQAWGYMNGWGPDEEARLAEVIAKGYKFKSFREYSTVTVHYNLELKVYYRVDSSG